VKRLAEYLSCGLVAAVTAALTALTRFTGPPIYCGDGWFHVRYAAILRSDGIARTFPWFQESFLSTRFTDFNLLYHLLLIPFIAGDELAGARVASVVFATFAMGAFWWCLRSLGVPWPAFWPLLLLAIAPEFAYRLTYTRPLVLAMALTFLGMSAILRGKGKLAFVLTFLYAHTHCSFHLLPCLALLRKVSGTSSSEDKVPDTFLPSLGGAIAGSILTPYFPNNLAFWWTANVGVLRASWQAGDLLRVGTEMLPMPTNELLFAHLGVFVLSGLALYALTQVERVSADARTLLVTAGGFFVLTLLSQRFAELWAPFTVMLAGVVARDLRITERVTGVRRIVVAGFAVVVLVVGLRHTSRDNRASATTEDPPLWRDAARWMRANVPAGETIFHLGWDEFPELFFEDPTHRYLIGQDATFFWATNPARCRLWGELARGRVDDAWSPVRETFRARWAFVPLRYRSFLRLARRDPRFVEAWSDANAVVFRVDDDGATVAGWEISGWWTVADAPRPPIVACSMAGFVDLARGSRLPAGVLDACAAASTTIVEPAGGPAQLGVTTDDEITIRLNGAAVYERSPHRPTRLSEILGGVRPGTAEVEKFVTLQAGENRLEVTSCRTGEDFGFILRVRGGRP
jgi:hypothetical protein